MLHFQRGQSRAFKRHGRVLAMVVLGLGLSACGSIGSKVADSFTQAIVNNDDPATVEAAIPSYLVMLDALVRADPDSAEIKEAAATLNSAYASAFVKDEARTQQLSSKALDYALGALCHEEKSLCDIRQMDMTALKTQLDKLDKDSVPLLYTVGSTWAGWIQAHSADFNAVADLPRVQALMARVATLNEKYEDGAADLYLGVMATLLPPALGGRPEEGKAYFEKALLLSQGHNLLVKLYYAKNYARSIYDRPLHDRLLNEVIAADPHAPGWTLSNVLAQRQAQDLLKSADEYF